MNRSGPKIPLKAGATRQRRSERRQGVTVCTTSKRLGDASARCGNASRTISGYYNKTFVKTYCSFGNSFILVSHRVVQDSREPVSRDGKKLVNRSDTNRSASYPSHTNRLNKSMTDSKPVSMQACDRHVQPRKRTPHRSGRRRNSLHPTLSACRPERGTESTRRRTASISYELAS